MSCAITQTLTGHFYESDGALVNRLAGRVAGDAVATSVALFSRSAERRFDELVSKMVERRLVY